ncbi:hypothetical protein QF035_002304 [Streptomyces umbrinus]|uniref:Uncharacterized protein n=1 Tax=Streptomyces umbrinus TaxID=67370 RepID=A0ABU0SMD1_9ACTN|nr:hypothetical protein [Streptomyces umbrinus]
MCRPVQGMLPFLRATPAATLMAVLPSPLRPTQRAGRLPRLITGLLDTAPDNRLAIAEVLTLSSMPSSPERPPKVEENKVTDKPGNLTEGLGYRA